MFVCVLYTANFGYFSEWNCLFHGFVILAFDSLERRFECVCLFLVVYIAVQLTHNFKPTCTFLFCIKEYAEIITIYRDFYLFYNSEYVVTEDEKMLVK